MCVCVCVYVCVFKLRRNAIVRLPYSRSAQTSFFPNCHNVLGFSCPSVYMYIYTSYNGSIQVNQST